MRFIILSLRGGKLPLTFPKSVNDLPHPQIPFFPQVTPSPFDVNYTEGLLVGYKWYDAIWLDAHETRQVVINIDQDGSSRHTPLSRGFIP